VKKHRFNFARKTYKGFDPNKNRELEIMHECGYYRVLSCGQEKGIYKMKVQNNRVGNYMI
jgi:hypothetical protein